MTEKILIVDDDLDSLKLIGLMLQRQGYEIVAANSGAQALQKVAEGRPDLIILDVMMPDMNGYEVARQLRADSQTAGIPIIMFTAKGTVDDKVAGFEAGADDYLTKPTHPVELASRVKVLLNRNNQRPTSVEGEPGRIVSFIGVKGGVGTTTIALNGGIAMSHLLNGSKVIVAEMQPGQGNLGLMLGFSRTGALGNLLSKGPKGPTGTEVEAELLPHQTGVNVLLASPTPDPRENDFSPEAAEILVRSLASVARYVVLDLGHGLSDANKRLVTISKQVIVCLEPHRVAVGLAEHTMRQLQELGLGPLRVSPVLVSRTPSSLQMSWQTVQQTLQRELLAIISPAPELAYQSLEHQNPMIQIQPESITSGQFRKLGEDLLAMIGPVSEPMG